jgi:hypothetical protein
MKANGVLLNKSDYSWSVTEAFSGQGAIRSHLRSSAAHVLLEVGK